VNIKAQRALAVFCRSGEAATVAARMKRSVLNVRFKTERIIPAAAAVVSPLRQKTASARWA